MSSKVIEASWAIVRELAERGVPEWEGEDLAGDQPLTVHAARGSPRHLLIVTKAAPVIRWEESDRPPGLTVVVRAGCWSRSASALLRCLMVDARRPVCFVGDADPMDLHSFLSLRAYLGESRIRFCGVSDALLSELGGLETGQLVTLPLSPLETEQLRIVERLYPRTERILGMRTASLLSSGRKIEMEALSFRAGLIPSAFKAALRLARR